jgi:tetratricopeptide (TPR) repeat protein/predicted Ser/Thr protein kinase
MPAESPRRADANGKPAPDPSEDWLDAALAAQRRDWLAGGRTPAADWLRRDPAWAAEAAVFVFHEFLLRQELGDAPDWEDYLRRFPDHADALRQLREVDRVVERGLAPPAAQACPADRFGDYELLGELGRGGMGVVYKARQTKLDRLVALKVIRAGEHSSAEERRRFDREARAVARLHHPHVVQVYDLGEADGRPFFAMEYVEGTSLARRLDGTPWPADRAAALVEASARAIHYAHGQGIVHRDLKPANILLTADGQPRITDFGLAKWLDGPGKGSETGQALGTPSYMAPEQAGGNGRPVGPPADVYALGTVLYELLTGRPPFRAATALETAVQVLKDEPVRPGRLRPGLPKDLETVCLKCLEKDPPKRFASAEALADDLRRFREGKPIHARPVGLAGRAYRWCRRRPAVAGLLAVLVLTAATALAGFAHLYGQTVAALRHEEAARRKSQDRDRRTRQILALLVRPDRKLPLQPADARRQLRLAQLTRAAEHYEALLREEPDDVTLQTALADVYASASLLHYEPGQLADALAFSEKALGLWGPGAQVLPDYYSAHRHWLATVEVLDLGDAVPDAARGRLADALALAEKALALWRRVAEAHPGSPEYRGSLADAYLAKGLLHRHGGEIGEALSAFRHACAAWRALADGRPTPEHRYNLARAQRLLCEVLYVSGRTDESMRLMAACQTLLHQLRKEQPDEKRLVEHLARNYIWLEAVYAERGFEAGDAGNTRQAYDLLKEWDGRRPGDAAVRDTLGYLASALLRRDAVEPFYAEAVAPVEAACRSAARRLEEEPTNQGLCRQLEWLYQGLSQCHGAGGQPARQMEAWDRYTQLLERLANQNPEARGLRLSLGRAYGMLAFVHQHAGDPQKAGPAAERAFAIQQALRPARGPLGGDAEQRFRWANRAWDLAHLIRQGGSPDKALHLAEQSRDEFLELVRESPADLRHACGLFKAWEEIGKAHVRLNRPDEALAAWLEGVAVLRRVIGRAPARLGYRQMLAMRCLGLSRHLRERGRLAEAAEWLLEREKLLPGDALYLRQTSQEFTRLAAAVGRDSPELTPVEQAERQHYLYLRARPAGEIPSWVPPATTVKNFAGTVRDSAP